MLSLYQELSMNARQYGTFSQISPVLFYLPHYITVFQLFASLAVWALQFVLCLFLDYFFVVCIAYAAHDE